MTPKTSSSPSRPPAEPRWATPRSPERDSFGPAIAAVAERLGLPLMPWQMQVAMVGGEMMQDPSTGLMIPAYRDVVMTVPRQSGKTALFLAWELQRALGWGSAQKILYSAQDGTAARKKMLEDQAPILEPRKAKLGIRRILRANGNEGVEFRNGSRIGLMAGAQDSGHGNTIHLAVKDEFFADTDDRRDQALGPAMITVATAQKLTASTAGTDASIPFNQLMRRGREAVDAGEREGIAYFEWSAPPDADPDDEEVWWSCMPALGITQTVRDVRHEFEVTFAGKPDEFRRAYLNIPTRSDERLIPPASWDLVNDPSVAPAGRLAFGVQVNVERSGAAIAVCGDRTLEVVIHEAGVGWLVDTIRQLRAAHPHAVWAHDASPNSPMAAFLPDLAGVPLLPVKMPAACGSFFDAVADRTIKVRRNAGLDDAVAAAAKKASGDAWVFDHRGAVDISPLDAVTLALWATGTPVPTPGFVDLADFDEE